MEFLELEGRLILLRDNGLRGWALSPTDREWRAVSQDFAGRAWVEGTRITKEQASSRFYVDLDQLPGESA